MSNHIIALDQGTTSSRAILFDRNGQISGLVQKELTQFYPSPGWVEHDPLEILSSQLAAVKEVLEKTGITASDIASIGITNQRETTIIWNRNTGQPIYNAIVWQDRRTADLCEHLRTDGNEPAIRAKTGLLIDPYFSASKIQWILDNVSGARALAGQGKLAFGTVDSWLVWNLTKGQQHVTDRTNAARTLLYNIVEDCWDEELLRLFDIPVSMIPGVVWSSQSIGRIHTSFGLGQIEIAGMAGDQQAALFGQLCLKAGDAKSTYGTGCFLLEHSGDRFTLSNQRLITTLACSIDRTSQYALEGSIFIGGAIVQWLRDNMKFFEHSADIESLAASATSKNLVFVPALTGLGASHWDPYAGGMIIGLDRSTTIADIALAGLESIAFQVTDVLHAMEADTGLTQQSLRVDGGASANDTLMQFQADMLGIPVERPAILETTALGTAYLAGLATGFWSSVRDIAQTRNEPTIFAPRMDRQEAATRYAAWHDAVGRSKDWNRPRA